MKDPQTTAQMFQELKDLAAEANLITATGRQALQRIMADLDPQLALMDSDALCSSAASDLSAVIPKVMKSRSVDPQFRYTKFYYNLNPKT
jgi:hypothetical protein